MAPFERCDRSATPGSTPRCRTAQGLRWLGGTPRTIRGRDRGSHRGWAMNGLLTINVRWWSAAVSH